METSSERHETGYLAGSFIPFRKAATISQDFILRLILCHRDTLFHQVNHYIPFDPSFLFEPLVVFMFFNA
jgi:hypothetical protein